MYLLRTVPTWQKVEALESFDQTQRRILENAINVTIDDGAWTQASLPVKEGGLGIRSACDMSLPAYFSSLHSAVQVGNTILPGNEELSHDPTRSKCYVESEK